MGEVLLLQAQTPHIGHPRLGPQHMGSGLDSNDDFSSRGAHAAASPIFM